jgi:2-polyprenyl-3-methyl-5-hydroxy-6-metoxy-1,4-benzoquinol methylase
MQARHIVIGIPVWGVGRNVLTPRWAARLCEVFLNSTRLYPTRIYFEDYPNLEAARTRIAQSLDSGWVFFLDWDVIPPPDVIPKLLGHDKDIVSGIYYSRYPPYLPQIYRHRKGALFENIVAYPKNTLMRVGGIGLGCCLINKLVFDTIEQPWFRFEGTYGEDLYFCRKASKHFDIWADTSIVCEHESTMTVDENTWMTLKAKLYEGAVNDKYAKLINAVNKTLEGHEFNTILDIGCGEGGLGKTLKNYCKKLIGIELSPVNRDKSIKTGAYDEILGADVRSVEIPTADVVVMLDFIEHLPKKDGMSLIKTLQKTAKMIILSTPSKFHDNLDQVSASNNPYDRHLCVWSRDELRSLGFDVSEIILEDILKVTYGNLLFAVWTRPSQ